MTYYKFIDKDLGVCQMYGSLESLQKRLIRVNRRMLANHIAKKITNNRLMKELANKTYASAKDVLKGIESKNDWELEYFEVDE